MELRGPTATGDHLHKLDHLTILQYLILKDDFPISCGNDRFRYDIAFFQGGKERHTRFHLIFPGAQDQFDHIISIKGFILP